MNDNNIVFDSITNYDITINDDGDITLIKDGKQIKLCDTQKILNDMIRDVN